MSTAGRVEAPRWARAMGALQEAVSQRFLGGPRLVKLAWIIDFQKGGTVAFVLALMAAYQNWSPAAWVYLALHGSYGLVWLVKDLALPDARWQTRVTVGGGVMAFVLVLGPYWLFPWLLVAVTAAPGRAPAPAPLLAECIMLHTVGVAVMLAADAQKHFTLAHRPGLITSGMYRYTRNPNYLGEMMVYASYALLVRHWAPWLILAWVWLGVFLPNMLLKDASLSRYPGFAAYRARTGLLVPTPWRRRTEPATASG